MAASSKYVRQPIVSVLGHVDHGKTSFLDFIRGSTVAARESGAITQHIGATEVPIDSIYNVCGDLLKGKKFTLPGLLFIDTPGHHAFTTLRARGGSLADIAVLIVDVNEGFKPQTYESIKILKQYNDKVLLLNKEAHVILAKHESSVTRLVTIEDTFKKLTNLSLQQNDLLEEALKCVQNRNHRAAHVLSWAAYIDCLEGKLASDGLKKILLRLRILKKIRKWWKSRLENKGKKK